jgi:hypothetical protein
VSPWFAIPFTAVVGLVFIVGAYCIIVKLAERIFRGR